MWKLEEGPGSVCHNCAPVGSRLVLEPGSKVCTLPAAGEGSGWRAWEGMDYRRQKGKKNLFALSQQTVVYTEASG